MGLLDRIEVWLRVHPAVPRAAKFAADEVAAVLVAVGLSVIAIWLLRRARRT